VNDTPFILNRKKSMLSSGNLASTTADAVRTAAARLLNAAAEGVPCAPVRDLIGESAELAAYQVQEQLTAARLAGGGVVVGRKIGLTSAAVQAQLGVDQPDFGVLFDDMAVEDGAVVPMARLLQPRIEAEVAFVLAEDLIDGPLDIAQARAAVAYASPALEIVDSRIAEWDITFADTVADNGSSGLFVIGAERILLSEIDPVDVTMQMSIDGEVVSSGSGADCLGDPLEALVWLARKSRELGSPLRAGQTILSGALGPMRPVAAGSVVTARIEGLGSVSVSFTGSNEEGELA
jgi:2-keto-4-pentenoate hydratase